MDQRLFIAINLSATDKLAIAKVLGQLPKTADIAPTKIDNLHLTLLFLGDTNPELVPNIQDQLNQIANQFNNFQISFTNLGAFPNLHKPQIFWLGLFDDNLSKLSLEIKQRISKIMPTDSKPFRAHITLARIKNHLPDSTINQLSKINLQNVRFHKISVTSIDLMSSQLTNNGPAYTLISSHPFLMSS